MIKAVKCSQVDEKITVLNNLLEFQATVPS